MVKILLIKFDMRMSYVAGYDKLRMQVEKFLDQSLMSHRQNRKTFLVGQPNGSGEDSAFNGLPKPPATKSLAWQDMYKQFACK